MTASRGEERSFNRKGSPGPPGGASRASRQSDASDPRGGLAPIQVLVQRWLKEHRSLRKVSSDAYREAWQAIVGSEIAQHTRVVDLVRGELIVEVDSAALLNELSTYFRAEILASMATRPELQGAQKIRFRSGSFDVPRQGS